MEKPAKNNERYHHGDLREVLISTALSLISEKGVSGLSLREVARRAGVSHGAPAHHFKDKSGLITAVAAQGFEALNASLLALNFSGEDLVAEFREAGMAYVRFAANHPAYFEVMFQPTLHQQDDEALLHAALTAFGHLKGAAEKITQTLNPKIDPDALALRAWSTAHGLSQLWLSGNLSQSFDREVLEQSLEAVFNSADAGYTSA